MFHESVPNTATQSVRQLAHRLSLMPPENEVRRKYEKLLLEKLYDMGVLSSASKLSGVEHGATVSAFARRRLPVVMTRLRMSETIVSLRSCRFCHKRQANSLHSKLQQR